MKTNFLFLQKEFPAIYKEIVEAENHTFTAQRYVEVYERKPFFGCIKTMKIWNCLMIPN